jgi:regulator of protease activity HflC (stomatin/prohibitin superfamily)
METHEKSYKVKVSGFVAILIQIVLVAVAVLSFITGPEVESHVNVGVIALVIACIIFPGYGVNEPNVSHVMTFFGKYTGTVFSNGFYWVNPFFIQKKVMLRIHNLDVEPIKVNDKVGNPVMIGAVLVWRVKDTYKAIFDINKNIEEFVKVQSDAALRQVAGMYAYDSNSSKTDDDSVTLRSDNNGEVAQRLENELSSRLSLAGIEVVEARINYLAYAQEIASVMLRRQQAEAIIAARERIVEGAVSMVHLALEKLQKDNVVELDEERKATMVSNLLVVLCADESARPVVNTGTLYQ